MIRINLLKNTNQSSRPGQDLAKKRTLAKQGASKQWLRLVLVFIVITGISSYLYIDKSLLNKALKKADVFSEKKVAPLSPKLTAPVKPVYQPKVVMGEAVEEVVKEIEGDNRELPKVTTYGNLLPGVKVEYQLAMNEKVLNVFKRVTTPEIGYIDMIVTAPGDIYVHGLASSMLHYQAFKNNLSQASEFEIKPGVVRNYGADEVEQEFSFYGTVKQVTPASGGSRVVSGQNIQSELQKISDLVNQLGLNASELKLKTRSDVGIYKLHIYVFTLSDCSYSQFTKFVSTLNRTASNFGILKFAMTVASDNSVNINVHFGLYSD